MATIESLDLATLVNNPQSIAEALEDALETSVGSLSTLKSQAEASKGMIDTLLTQSQTAKNAIDDLLTDVNAVESYYEDSLDNSWVAWDLGSNLSSEKGIRMQRFGKIYVVHCCCYLSTGTGAGASTIKTVSSSDLTLPSATVRLGMNSPFINVNEKEYITNLEFKTNGELKIFYQNEMGGTLHLLSTFVGVDQG